MTKEYVLFKQMLSSAEDTSCLQGMGEYFVTEFLDDYLRIMQEYLAYKITKRLIKDKLVNMQVRDVDVILTAVKESLTLEEDC